MKWVKIGAYILTYVVLIIASGDIFINAWDSIGNMFGTIQESNELDSALSLIVELLTAFIIIILFFIPIGGLKGEHSLNLHYYIDSAYQAILDSTQNKTHDKHLRNKKLLSLLYNLVIFLMIISSYIILLVLLGDIKNGLSTLIFLLLIYILMQSIDFVTSIIAKLDLSEVDDGNNDYISKKNTITWIMILGIFTFLYLGIPFVEIIYNAVYDFPFLSLFDGDRINIK